MFDSIRGILNQNNRNQTELSVDEVYQLLSNERRRRAIRLLRNERGELDVGRLAELMANEVGSKARTREYVALHQQHLPRLHESGIVRYDEREKVVRPGNDLEVLYRIDRRVVSMLPKDSQEDH